MNLVMRLFSQRFHVCLNCQQDIVYFIIYYLAKSMWTVHGTGDAEVKKIRGRGVLLHMSNNVTSTSSHVTWIFFTQSSWVQGCLRSSRLNQCIIFIMTKVCPHTFGHMYICLLISHLFYCPLRRLTCTEVSLYTYLVFFLRYLIF